MRHPQYSKIEIIYKKKYETRKFELDRKPLRTTDYEYLETAVTAYFKQVRSQNLPVSRSLLMENTLLFAEQLKK